MTIAVDMGRKATKTNKQKNKHVGRVHFIMEFYGAIRPMFNEKQGPLVKTLGPRTNFEFKYFITFQSLSICCPLTVHKQIMIYSKTSYKRGLKKKTKIGFQDR